MKAAHGEDGGGDGSGGLGAHREGVERGGGSSGGRVERTFQIILVALVPSVEVYVGVHAFL